jgi:S1-C subfamily serine protease
MIVLVILSIIGGVILMRINKKIKKEQVINNIKSATFLLLLPDPIEKLPIERGTAFFISPDGYMITANHVIEDKKENDNIIVRLPPQPGKIPTIIHGIEVIKKWPKYDLALLKAAFDKNRARDFLKGKREFNYIEIDFSQHFEGKEVYVYGYPLPKKPIIIKKKTHDVAYQSFSPRLTSASISSICNYTGLIQTERDIKYYALDKSLNYGNSGGPIVLQESGKVIAVCIEFQPVDIPQSNGSKVTIPSQYSITSSLKNIENYLKDIIRH